MLQNKYKRVNGKFVIIPDRKPAVSVTRPKKVKKTKKEKSFSQENAYVYGLFSPILNKYFYVGQTKNPVKRQHQHQLIKDDNVNKKYHIRLLKSKKLSFRMDILAEISTTLINKWERGYINHIRKLGHPLTNREKTTLIEAKDVVTNEDIETLLMLDDEQTKPETIHHIKFLSNL